MHLFTSTCKLYLVCENLMLNFYTLKVSDHKILS